MIVKARCGNGYKLYEASEVAWLPYTTNDVYGGELEFIENDHADMSDHNKIAITMEIPVGHKTLITRFEENVLDDNRKTVDKT